jgi:hypothetical protein
MINTDIFLEIGNSHKICEDYIIQGIVNNCPYVILADGCSSSDNTEMGARLLCHLAKQYLKFYEGVMCHIDYDKMGNWIIHNAELSARQLGLKKKALDATLIVAFTDENGIYIYMYGDGLVVLKKYDPESVYKNNYLVFTADFKNNEPYYLSYRIDEYRNNLYHDSKNELSITIEDNSIVEDIQTFAYDYQNILTFELGTFDQLFIASDGLASFIDDNPTELRSHSPFEVCKEFMSFKNLKGEFLKRRMKRALKKFSELGYVHYDDLSIGAFNYTRKE